MSMSRTEAVLATIGEQATRAEEQLAAAERLATATDRLRVTGHSGDGSVEVTVDGVGQLVDVAFRGRLGDTTPHALRAAVLRAHGRAREALTAQVGRLAEEAYGPGSPAAAAITSAYTRVHGAAGATRGAES